MNRGGINARVQTYLAATWTIASILLAILVTVLAIKSRSRPIVVPQDSRPSDHGLFMVFDRTGILITHLRVEPSAVRNFTAAVTGPTRVSSADASRNVSGYLDFTVAHSLRELCWFHLDADAATIDVLSGGGISVGGDPRTAARPGVARMTAWFWQLAVPVWVPIALLLLGPSAWIRRRVRTAKRFTAGHCQRCGYDLRASPGRCPECGLVVL